MLFKSCVAAAAALAGVCQAATQLSADQMISNIDALTQSISSVNDQVANITSDNASSQVVRSTDCTSSLERTSADCLGRPQSLATIPTSFNKN